jgi:hypothetical protein
VLVNGEGQEIRSARANGRIVSFEDRPSLSYVCGDAAPAYVGKLDRFNRHVLLLRPGLILMLDDLAAPEAATYQWLLHAFDEMILGDGQIVSRRGGKTLDVRLFSEQGLAVRQTDQFDTPFNAGIPESFHKEMPNHWHATAETIEKSSAARIGAVLGVCDELEHFDLEVLTYKGWFGARATGAAGSAEGWVQTVPGARGPDGFGISVGDGSAKICGRGSDGALFSN